MKISDEITELWDDLLQQLPLPVRDSVRSGAEQRAAERAEENSGKLSFEDGVRAFIESVPFDLRANLGRTLNLHGVDPADFDDAFSS
jgi:hypothetical protein